MKTIANLLILVVMFISCEKNINTSVRNESQYIPNTPGSSWIYELVRIPFGTRDSTYVGDLTIAITSEDSLITGQQVSRWEIVSPDSNINQLLFGSPVGYVWVTHTKMVWYSVLSDTLGTLIYRFPLTPGKTWKRGNAFVSLVDSLEDISVPAGTFSSCSRVRTQGGWWQAPVKRVEWVKRGIGIIKMTYSQVGLVNASFALKLKTYHIADR